MHLNIKNDLNIVVELNENLLICRAIIDMSRKDRFIISLDKELIKKSLKNEERAKECKVKR